MRIVAAVMILGILLLSYGCAVTTDSGHTHGSPGQGGGHSH